MENSLERRFPISNHKLPAANLEAIYFFGVAWVDTIETTDSYTRLPGGQAYGRGWGVEIIDYCAKQGLSLYDADEMGNQGPGWHLGLREP
jgi:hypothetical protein